MNIDQECVSLLNLILQDSPQDRQLILCILARSNAIPSRIIFNPNTAYPTFYGYSNNRIPFYLMEKGVIINVPRVGWVKRLISSDHLSYAEATINKAQNWDINQKLSSISKFIILDNKTVYADAEVFLVFKERALILLSGESSTDGLISSEKTPSTDRGVAQGKFTKRELRKKLNGVLKVDKFGTKEKKFLKFLATDFEPHTIEEISSEINTRDCKHLKGRVKNKIIKTGFSIKSIKANGWGKKSQYQLEYLPTSVSL